MLLYKHCSTSLLSPLIDNAVSVYYLQFSEQAFI